MATFSLASAGIGYRPPFVRAEQIGDAPFYVVHAEINQNGYGGRPELYAVLDMIPTDEHEPVAYDEDGQPVNRVAWTAALTSSREDIVRFFRAHPGDQLGPCMFLFVPSKTPGNAPFAQLTDYTPVTAISAPQRQQQRQQQLQQQQLPQRPQPRPAAQQRHPRPVVNAHGEEIDNGLPF